MSKPKNDYGLNLKQKEFCDIYLSAEHLGNGIDSYAIAYNIDTSKPIGYNTARTNASKLLTNANILLYMNDKLDETGFNDANADAQLTFVMKQNADFGSKVAAIKEYNKLKGRIEDRLAIKVQGYDVTLNLNKKTS